MSNVICPSTLPQPQAQTEYMTRTRLWPKKDLKLLTVLKHLKEIRRGNILWEDIPHFLVVMTVWNRN